MYKFESVSCSQCGQDFGPGNHGFSHCENHAGKPPKTENVWFILNRTKPQKIDNAALIAELGAGAV